MSRLSFYVWLCVLLFGAASGALYSTFIFGGKAYIGACYAVVMLGVLLAVEQDLILPRFRLRLLQLPTLAYILTTLLLNIITIEFCSFLVGSMLWLLGLTESWLGSVIPTRGVMIYALCVSSFMVFVLRMRDLLGPDLFLSLLVSRYRQPRSENRVFLFVDLMGSTSYAERYGDLDAQRYLGEFFKTVALSVRHFKGSVDDYIGDAALITWTFDKGIRNAACIRCVLHIHAAIKASEANWIREFGEVPRLRAALHGGPVVIGEIGLEHRKITFFGDTVNTSARIEGLAKDLEKDFLISDSLLGQITAADWIKSEPLGSFALRGKGQLLDVTAIDTSLSRPV